MKMVTKTFQKLDYMNLGQLDSLVNKHLKAEYCIDIWHEFSKIQRTSDYAVVAKCNTPRRLSRARYHNTPILFSVTLPKEYWR